MKTTLRLDQIYGVFSYCLHFIQSIISKHFVSQKVILLDIYYNKVYKKVILCVNRSLIIMLRERAKLVYAKKS